MRRWAAILLILLAVGAGLYWALTRPAPVPDGALAGLEGDAERGRRVFWAAGCAACHIAPDAEDVDEPVLSGGRRFATPFGIFVAPNISPDPEHGIGGWSARDLANALIAGLSPDGAHYFPALPYTTYARARPGDVVDLKAFLDTLPRSSAPNEPHDLGFPFNIRRNLGLWKRLNMPDGWVVTGDLTETQARGRYLVEALGHCGECHTPRGPLGGLDTSRWLAGAPDPAGDGRIPAITPDELGWSADEIAGYLASGFTPSYDVAGGSMTEVIDGLSRLPESDLQAIGEYLVALNDGA